jgi:xanthine dehydrogenase YagT iron-sulfur-binding subunit
VSFKKGEGSTAPRNRFSRRGFLGGVGLGGGALGAGLLETEAAAQSAVKVVGPGPGPVTLNINGKPVNLTIEPRVTLLDAMRNYLGITGAKRVCDRGTCGACTVLIDGKSVYSCTVLAIDAQGRDIQTIEGLAPGNGIHPVSAAFVNNDAQQCGYCTAGFVMAVQGFLGEHPNPTMEDVKHGLGGNLCRCGTYMGVRQAALEVAAATRMKGGKNG